MLTDEEFNDQMLMALEKSMQGCENCSLADNREHLVFGEGNSYPDLAIVGEAPGAQEDRRGRVFCGESGILLRRLLKMIGLARGKTYLLNATMCRPPRNRTPRPQELKACRPRLVAHISALRPRVILLMGATAASWCGSRDQEGRWQQLEGGVGRNRGRVPREFWPELDVHGRARLEAVFIGYHPAYVIRQDTKKGRHAAFRQFLVDLRRVKKYLEAA